MKKTVGVIGSGLIAASYAVLLTGHGYPAWVLVRSEKSREKLIKSYRSHFGVMVKNGILTDEQVKICETYLHVTDSYPDMKDCSIFLEAVTEDKYVKASVFEEIVKSCPDAELICSASSAITPDMMLEALENSEYYDEISGKLIIAHPFYPSHIVPYVEMCGSSRTEPDKIAAAVDLMKKLDREPVVLKKPTPGFIGNRLQFALLREAIQLVEEGVCDFEDIDRALQFSFCPRYTSIGLFEHMDYAGLDLDDKNCKLLFPIISDRKDTPPSITERLAEGKIGTKSGEGFYDWHGRDLEAYAERVNKPYWRFCHWDFPEK